MPPRRYRGRDVSGIVEGQMRRWEIHRSEKAKSETRTRLEGYEIDYITVSRQAGSGGDEIGRVLCDLMKWELFDKEILNFMSENMAVQQEVLEKVDQKRTGWIEEFLAPLFSDKPISQMDYYRHLVRVLFLVAQEGKAIIMGRSAGLVLPRDRGLSVRITAPLEVRVERYAAEMGIKPKEALAAVEKADKEQEAFVKQFLHKDITDPRHYDLVVNTAKLGPMAVAKLIWRGLDQRQLDAAELAAQEEEEE